MFALKTVIYFESFLRVETFIRYLANCFHIDFAIACYAIEKQRRFLGNALAHIFKMPV